jgi:hypothetical protein
MAFHKRRKSVAARCARSHLSATLRNGVDLRRAAVSTNNKPAGRHFDPPQNAKRQFNGVNALAGWRHPNRQFGLAGGRPTQAPANCRPAKCEI